MLQVAELSRPGLELISFTVDSGHCLAMTGPSGAGKSLLLRAIADLDPNEGSVRVGASERKSMPAPEWRRLVGLVPAESGWWTDTVGEHFADADKTVAHVEEIGLPADALGWQVSRLSTGERHRLALARALLLQPKVLLLDEPTAALDKQATALVESVIQKRMADGAAVVLVTHDAAQIKRMSQSVMELRDGRAGGVEPVS